MQGIRVVADNVEAAAFCRALGSERAHDDVAARPNGASDLANVRNTLLRIREEMKDSPVMPNVISPRPQLHLRYVRDQPVNSLCGLSQPLPAGLDGDLRDIQDCDVLKSSCDQVVNERGFASAYVDDRSGKITRGSFDQGQRGFQVLAVPAHLVGRFGGVNFLPMRFYVHGNGLVLIGISDFNLAFARIIRKPPLRVKLGPEWRPLGGIWARHAVPLRRDPTGAGPTTLCHGGLGTSPSAPLRVFEEEPQVNCCAAKDAAQRWDLSYRGRYATRPKGDRAH